MPVIAAMVARLGLDDGNFRDRLDDADDRLSRFERRLDQLDGATKKAAIGMGASLAGTFAPAIAAAAATQAAFVSAAAAAQTGIQAFSLAVQPQMEKLEEVASAMEEAEKKAAEGGEEAAKAQKKYNDALAELTPVQREAAKSYIGLKQGYQDWSTSLSDDTLPVMTRGMTLLRNLLPTLSPFVREAAGAFQVLLGEVEEWTSSGAFKSFIGDFSGASGDAIESFGKSILNLVKGFTGILQAFVPMQEGVTGGLVKMTEGFANWGQSLPGSEQFAAFQEFAAAGGDSMKTLGEALLNLVIASAPLLQAMAKITQVFAEIIAATPAPVLTALGVVLGATAVALRVAALAAVLFAEGSIGARIATAAWTGIQTAFNAVMAANPIALAVIAIAALIAIVVVAYRESETFRNIVQTAWVAIQAATRIAWDFLRGVFQGIWDWIRDDLIPAFQDLWAGVVTVWNGIRTAITTVWNFIRPIWETIADVIENVLVFYFKFLQFQIELAWFAIRTAIILAWRIIEPIWDALVALLTDVIVPTFRTVAAFIADQIMDKIVEPTRAMMTFLKPLWDGFVDLIKGAWENGIKPAWDALKDGLGLIQGAFKTAVDAIGTIWGGLQAVVRKPVEFVLYTVYRDGLKNLWDKVAGMVDLPKMPDPPQFATGGPIHGPGTGTSDSILARVSTGEFVVNAASTRKWFPLIQAINSGRRFAILNALGMVGDPGGILPGFAPGGLIGGGSGGGLLGGIGDFFESAKDFFSDGLVKVATAAMNPLIAGARSAIGGTFFGDVLVGLVTKIKDSILEKFKPLEEKMGGPGRRAAQAALTQIGVPYSWGGGGPNGPTRGIAQGARTVGFDCSGLVQYGWYQSVKKVTPRTTYDQIPWSRPVSTPREGDLGFPHAGHVFIKTAKGIVEAPFTGARVREVAARPADWRRPPASFMGTADDGMASLIPGWNAVYNGTGQMEYLSTSNAKNTGQQGGDTIVLENRGVIGSQAELERWFTETYAELQRKRRVP